MAGYDEEKINFFAKTDARGQQVPFGIKAKDRQRHMYVIGKTGMGKSTLLENMAAQDLQNGEGMAFIDPHGSAIEVLLDYVPEDRLDDVVYFAPFDMDHPIAFNIMEDVGIDKRHLVVSGLMSTFKKIWVDAWSARMEYILTNALLALIEYPDTTLLSVNRMLADKKYRDEVVANVKDPAVKAYWVDEFASYTERFAAEALPAIQNKIGQFTGNPLIRNIIGQPKSSFDVREMMDNKKILLINLSKGLVGETNADLIGSMLITKIYLAAMSRAELPPAQMKQMPNFYFYVDEFQSFANATFANILSEARKYHLNLIIAHQYVQQMEEEIRDAVFGNVGTTISFRVGPFDAEVLETVFAPEFEATDLVNLGFAQIYLSLMIDGVGSRPFSAKTLPPVQTPHKSFKQMVIKRSQQNYCRPRAEVEQAVVDSHAPQKRIEEATESGGGNKGGFTKPSAFHKVGTDKKSPQNKSGNGQNGSQSSNPKNHQSKSKQPVKTADDLKDILATMTKQAQPTPPQSRSAFDTKSATPPEQPKQSPATTALQPDARAAQPAPTDPAAQSTPTPSQPQSVAVKTDQPNQTNQAQTTKEDKRPTADTDTKQPPKDKTNNAANNARPKTQLPPKQKSATPDDLRSILAQLAQKTNQAQSQPKTQSKPEPKSVAAQSGIKREQPPASTQDLRPILQDMLRHKNQQASSNQSPQSNQNDTRDQTQRHKSATKKTPQDLKAALAKVVAKTNPKPAEPATATGAPAIAPVQPPVATTAPTKPTTTTQYQQSVEPADGRVRQPAYIPYEQSSSPDINVAKKILRHSGKERPPGT